MRHPPEQVKYIAGLMLELGWTSQILLDDKKEGEMIAGHCRLESAALLVSQGHLRFAKAPVIFSTGWTDQQKQAYRIQDNVSSRLGGWNEELIKLEIMDLQANGFSVVDLGFADQELIDFGVLEGEADGGELGGKDRHALLKLVDITIDDPKSEVAKGDHFILSKRHHLFVVSVITEWQRWSGHLTEGILFAPYAGVFVPFSEKAKASPLLMVQPDPYIAGHILDRYIEVHGKKSIAKQESSDGDVSDKA